MFIKPLLCQVFVLNAGYCFPCKHHPPLFILNNMIGIIVSCKGDY